MLGMVQTLKMQGNRPANKHSWARLTQCQYLYCEFQELDDEHDCDCDLLFRFR